MDSSIVPYLFLATFVIALLYALLQYRSAKKAQREHHRSAEAEAHHEPVTPNDRQERADPARSAVRDARRE